ncbi:MAG: sugar phosphate isomerase/epimerase, partial [Bryobacteraceae bacterium]
MTTRRAFGSCLTAGLLPGWATGLRGLKIGVTDWNLRKTSQLEAVGMAKALGFEGVEISLGRAALNGKLPLDDDDKVAAYLAEFKKHQFEPAGTCLDILHVNYLKNDKMGAKWVSDGIRVTRKLGAKV